MTVEQRNQEPSDQFPKGLRVLAVDDNPGCLRILDQLLKKCEYQVTTTTKAVTALNMLRENKDKFDLVITDVQMPDMDGFELLEQVGLEMDLPVIMLSAYDDHKLVMKGITHGACDYLLKPVRLEAVKTIWRHVIHKKKSDSMGQKSNYDSIPSETGEGEQRSSDQTGKLNNKRKNEENDESVEEIEDPSTQKRPRVVWSKELHRKFLDAVEQLGVDKAVPKKIQQLMNVENLSRENVASHLQKFRMSIRKINEVSRQHANMASAYNNTNSSYFRLGSYNGVGTFNTLSGSHVQNQPFAPYSQKAMLGRLNSSAGLGICRPSSASSGMGQLSPAQNTISDFGKFHQGNQNNTSIFQGMPLFEFNQLQNKKNAVDKLPTFLDTKVAKGDSGNSLVGTINNSLVPYTPFSETQHELGFGNQSSAVSCSNNWPNAVQSNSFVLNNHYKQAPFSNMNNISRLSQLGSNSFQDISSSRSDGAWNYQKQDILHYPNSVYGLVNNSPVAVDNACSLEQSLDSKTENFNRNDDFNVTVLNGSHMLLNEVGSTNALPTHGSYSCNSFGSLDDLLDDVLKQDQEEVSLIDGDFGCDTYSLGT